MVGPNSAGAVPGPICYDMGGTEPTVTDADLILGYLNPNYFIGGRMKLDKERSIQYVKEKIANKLGMDVVESAAGIYAIINAHMADLIRKVTIERGYDPRNFVLFAYGGAGPVHAGSYGEDLETIEIVIPSTASVHSAMGILASDIIHTYELSDPMVVPVDVDRVNQIFESLEQKGIEDLFSEGFKENDISIFRYVDMRYRRQVHEIRVPVPLKKLTSVDLEVVIKDFEILYEKSYGKGSAFREAGMEMITFRIEAMGKLFKPSIAKYDLSLKSPLRALKTKREVFFNKYKDFILTRIYDFGELQPGNIIEGPAIIETPVTTIVVNPDQIARVDRYKNVIIKYNEYS
jgi:N-methylhydantoinase A